MVKKTTMAIDSYQQPFHLGSGLEYPVTGIPGKESNFITHYDHIYLIRVHPKDKRIKVSGSCLPISLLMISGYLKSKGHTNVSVIDTHSSKGMASFNELIEIGKSGKMKGRYVFGITMVSTVEYEDVMEDTRLIKKLFPDSITVLGGIHVTADPASVLMQEAVDYVVSGDGEVPMHRLLKAFNGEDNIEEISGLGYRKAGLLHINAPDYSYSLDDYPDLDLDAIDIFNYLLSKNNTSEATMEMLTSRGCPRDCIFCMGSAYGKQYRWRAVNKTIDEIEQIKNKYGISIFYFRDSDFLLNEKRCEEFANELLRRKIDIQWQCQSDSIKINEKVLGALKEAGLKWITFGIESTKKECLDAIGKGHLNKDLIDYTINITHKNNVKIRLFFMVGLPYQTFDDVMKDMEYSNELIKKGLIDDVRVNHLRPHPGTPVFNHPAKYGTTIFKHTPKDERFTSYKENFDNQPVFETKWMDKATIVKATQIFIKTIYPNIPVWGSDIFK